MSYCRIVFVVFCTICSALPVLAQTGYKGKDFWLAFPQNALGEKEFALEQIVYIIGPEGTEGIVKENGTGNEYPFTINALGSWKCTIDTANTVITDGIHQSGVHIVATEDIYVYAVSHRKASSDSYAAIPTSALGKDYVVIGYDPVSAGTTSFATQFEVIATENDTKVTVRYPTAVVFDTTPRVEVLKKGQILHIGGKVSPITSDLTGTTITSNKPVGVLTGHSCAQVPPGVSFCDFLAEMLLPSTALGKEHVVARLAERERSTVRVLAAFDNTIVSVDGKKKLQLNRGEYYQDEHLKNTAIISTTQPAYVMQFGHSSDDDVNKVADPFMMLIAPADRFITETDLIVPVFKKTQDEIEHEQIFSAKPPDGPIYSEDSSHIYYPNKSMTIIPPAGLGEDPAKESGWSHWMNIITTSEGIEKIKLDGKPVAPPMFRRVGESNYYVAQMKVQAGRHILRSDVPFAAYLYGYGKGGANYDSYGHLCGQRVD